MVRDLLGPILFGLFAGIGAIGATWYVFSFLVRLACGCPT